MTNKRICFKSISEIKSGDVLIIWNMPWLIASLVDVFSGQKACHHCGIVLDSVGELLVYESTVPKSRRVHLNDYIGLMTDWANNWRYKLGRPPFRGDVWRLPYVEQHHLNIMKETAISMLGIGYQLYPNFFRDTKKLHCSEYVSRILLSSGLMVAEMFGGRVKDGRTNEVRPIDLHNALQEANARLIGSFEKK